MLTTSVSCGCFGPVSALPRHEFAILVVGEAYAANHRFSGDVEALVLIVDVVLWVKSRMAAVLPAII
jgi:hypothetical protein